MRKPQQQDSDKSWAIGKGKLTDSNFNIWKEDKKDLKYLGYRIAGEDIKEITIAMIGVLQRKKCRMALTLIGKIKILNTYGLSKLYYHMYCNQMSKEALLKIYKIIRWFLFSKENKYNNAKHYPAWIKRDLLIKIGLMDVKQQWLALRASMVLRIMSAQKKSQTEELIMGKLFNIRESRKWDVSPFMAKGVYWLAKHNNDPLDSIMKELWNRGMEPYQEFIKGDKGWVWTNDNYRYYKCEIIKAGNMKEGEIKIKAQNGKKMWVPRTWVLIGKCRKIDERKWCKLEWLIHGKRINKIKEKDSESDIREKNVKILRKGAYKAKNNIESKDWKILNNIKEMKKIEGINNKTLSFGLKWISNYPMAKENWRGNIKDEEKICERCNWKCVETQQHIMKKCPRTLFWLNKLNDFKDKQNKKRAKPRILNKKGRLDINEINTAWWVWKIRCLEVLDEDQWESNAIKIWEKIEMESNWVK